MNRLLCLIPLILLLPVVACQSESPDISGFSPAESLAQLDLPGEFEVQLMAAEPLIADPVAMEIDEQGRVYIVEMPGYPLDLGKTGKIKQVIDEDGDGVWDRSIVFAEDLTLPNGIMRWKNGFLVTDAPNVLFLADTNSDGRADVREVVLTGFALSNPQHNFNTPIYGLDNWVYLANEYAITSVGFDDILGDEGSEITFPGKSNGPKLPQNGGDRNIRFRPDTYELEMRSSNSQYGHTFDAWGHHFSTGNAAHLWHEVLAAPYLQAKPELWSVDAVQYVPSYGRPAEVFPRTDQPVHQLLTDVGTITSACGITWYQGGAFPPPYDRVVFTGEPTHNLVHASIVEENGPTFSASRLMTNQEFLTSTDPWFRPVNFYVGPAGELYVIDYYRKIIEHPEWMSDEVNNSGELYTGTQKGRIYRITANNQPQVSTVNLASASPNELVDLLSHSNIWYRRHAQRMLVDKQSDQVVEQLNEVATRGSVAVGRLHACWTLEGLGKLSPAVLRHALKDPVPGIRENAILLAESHLANYPTLSRDLLQMENDPDHRVRFQLICTLGRSGGMEFEAPLFRLLDKQGSDEWSILAVLTGQIGEQVARSYLFKKEHDPQVSEDLLRQLAARLGEIDGLQGDLPAFRRWIKSAKNGPVFMKDVLSGLARGISTSGVLDTEALQKEKLTLLSIARSATSPLAHASMDVLDEIGLPDNIPGQEALAVELQQTHLDVETQATRLRLLAMLAPANSQSIFEARLDPSVPTPVQQAAIRGLDGLEGTRVCEPLLTRWPQLTPALRDEAVGVMMRSPERMACILDAVEAKRIDPSTLGWRRTVHLLNQKHLPTRERARELLAQEETGQADIMNKFKEVPGLSGAPAAGQVVFQTLCSTCHQIQERGGVAFGPDLASVRHREPHSLMRDILIPQQSIADGFELWIAQTQEEETVSGIIVAESGDRLTLRDAAGTERILLRSKLKNLEASTYSAMTAGLGEQMTPQEMADLLAYLKRWPELEIVGN